MALSIRVRFLPIEPAEHPNRKLCMKGGRRNPYGFYVRTASAVPGGGLTDWRDIDKSQVRLILVSEM